MKTGPNASKFDKEYDELPVPDDGEYYLSLRLDKIRSEQEKQGWSNAKYKALFDSFGTKCLGVLPYQFTNSPDDVVVVIQLFTKYMHEKFDKDLLRNTDASEPIDHNVRYDLPKPIYKFNSSKVRDALGMDYQSKYEESHDQFV